MMMTTDLKATDDAPRVRVSSPIPPMQQESEADASPGHRIATIGTLTVHKPYTSHDGDVGYTVHVHEGGVPDDAEEHGKIIAEFVEKNDAIGFAYQKAAVLA